MGISLDEAGDYCHWVQVQLMEYSTRSTVEDLDCIIDKCIYHCPDSVGEPPPRPDSVGEPPPVSPRLLNTSTPDDEKLRPILGWQSVNTVQRTLEHTTQYTRIPHGTLLKKAYRSPNPALNVHRRSEPVACDIVHSDTPAIDNGTTAACIFVRCRSKVIYVYGGKSDEQFANTLEDNICERGAPTRLISDRAQVEISNKVLDILRTLFISAWQSEPHQQHQDFFERRYQHLKSSTNRVLNRSGAPPETWLLCLQYVAFLLNHSWDDTLKNIPLTALLGITLDVSVLLWFHFWQRVFYSAVEPSFPSQSKELLGHIVGISEHVGKALTWKVLTDDTRKIIFRSVIRPCTASDPDLRVDPSGGEISNAVIKSASNYDHGESETIDVETVNDEGTSAKTEDISESDEAWSQHACL